MKLRGMIFVCTFFLGVSVVLTDFFILGNSYKQIVVNMILVVIVSCISFYVPVLLNFIRKSGDNYKKKKELRFLKKIFVMSGSIKPVDYLQVVNAMYERAEYYKTDLEQITDVLRKSNVDKEEFFNNLLYETNDIDSKLFYEKMSIGFLYDFDLAIKSIEGDFMQEKRAYARFVKKRVNLIHIVGITGLFIIMTILLMYMLKPWLESMNLQLI